MRVRGQTQRWSHDVSAWQRKLQSCLRAWTCMSECEKVRGQVSETETSCGQVELQMHLCVILAETVAHQDRSESLVWQYTCKKRHKWPNLWSSCCNSYPTDVSTVSQFRGDAGRKSCCEKVFTEGFTSATSGFLQHPC